MVQQPRDSVTYAQLRELLQNERYKGELLVVGQSSSGLEAVVKRPEGYHFYTVTDLSVSGIVARGSVNITILAAAIEALADVTVDLTGSTANYLPFANAQSDQFFTHYARAILLSLTTLRVIAERQSTEATLLASSFSTSSTGSAQHPTHPTHSSIDVNITNPHTHDAHGAHGTAHTHFHSAPTTNQSLSLTNSSGDETVSVAWMIIRA